MKLALWNRYHCLLLLAASFAFLLTHSLVYIISIAFVSFTILFIVSRNELKDLKPKGGWANRVTAIRFLSVFTLAIIYHYISDFQIVIWLSLTLPLDGLDGYLARKRNEQTASGAYFDMETDVFFVCITSCILFLRGLAGYEIFIPAFIRYCYVFIVLLTGLHRITEKRTKIGPVIAVYTFISLTIAFIVPEHIRRLIVYSTVILLGISFTYSYVLLLKQRNI